ncbi:MAG TPA: FISUMP domain-containing protein [Ignavibacteriaceae bacterium]|nr:FISUMP domain-containing protein [Ignavibacteriaceae bacterium]
MKKLFLLSLILFLLGNSYAQNKTLTIYYTDSTKIINMANVDSMSIFICGVNKINYAGQYYNTVEIGNQCWLKENLNLGTTLTRYQNQSDNGIIEKWCYDDLQSNCTTYGGLYSWYETMQYVYTSGGKGICPTGWHIPTINDFLVLKSAVNNDGNTLKRDDQGVGGGIGTNTSGFSGLMAGYRSNSSSYGSLSYECFIWTSEPANQSFSNYLFLGYQSSEIFINNGHYKANGLSVRCIKN